MEPQEKQVITTGKSPEPTPILASGNASTAGKSTPAQAKNESASISVASTLALLQTDFSDLQSKGLRVSILARDGRLYASIEWPSHALSVSDTGKKSILLDGEPVVEYE
jgi:hypothetical protein